MLILSSANKTALKVHFFFQKFSDENLWLEENEKKSSLPNTECLKYLVIFWIPIVSESIISQVLMLIFDILYLPPKCIALCYCKELLLKNLESVSSAVDKIC